MITLPTIAFALQSTHLIQSERAAEGSCLGRILSHAYVCRLLNGEKASTHRDYLAELHQLSEFPNYKSASVDNQDEPIFFLLAPCVHGLTKGCCGLCIRLEQSGKSKQRGSQVRRFRTMAIVSAAVADGHGGFKTKIITRAVDGFENLSGYYSSKATPLKLCGTCLVSVSETAPIEPECLRRAAQPRHITRKMLEQLKTKDRECHTKKPGRNTYLNFCPRCWVARAQRVPIPKERACKDCKGLAQLDAAEAKRSAKIIKTLEDYCAELTAKRQRKLLEARRLRERFVYSSDGFDREILVSRGSVMSEAVRQFDRDSSRKGNKYRIQ